jgi:hypothetical protein
MATHSAETYKKTLFYLFELISEHVDLDEAVQDLPPGVEDNDINAMVLTIRLALSKAQAFDDLVDQQQEIIDAAHALDTSELSDEEYFKHLGALAYAESMDRDVFRFEQDLFNTVYADTHEWFDSAGNIVTVEGIA